MHHLRFPLQNQCPQPFLPPRIPKVPDIDTKQERPDTQTPFCREIYMRWPRQTPPSPRNQITLRLDDAYRQLLTNLSDEPIPTLTLPSHSTRSAVTKAIAKQLADDQTSVWFRRPPTPPAPPRQGPQRLDPAPDMAVVALTRPIVAARSEPLPAPKRASARVREDLRKMARETTYYPPYQTGPACTSTPGGEELTVGGRGSPEGVNRDKNSGEPGQE